MYSVVPVSIHNLHNLIRNYSKDQDIFADSSSDSQYSRIIFYKNNLEHQLARIDITINMKKFAQFIYQL